MINHSERLGVLGLGSRSTAFFIEQLNDYYQLRAGGYSTCPFLLLNANFDQFNPYLPNNFTPLSQSLTHYLHQLDTLPITRIAIPNITLHECYDHLSDQSTPLVHPVHSTINAIKHDQHSQVMVIGSRYSMEADYLKQIFSHANITVNTPSIRTEVEDIDAIRQAIYGYSEDANTYVHFQQLIEKYRQQYPVVIACTELSIALAPLSQNSNHGHLSNNIQPIPSLDSSAPFPVYDMTRIQAQCAVDRLF